MQTKRALIEGLTRESIEGLTRESEAYQSCRSAIYAAGGPLLDGAQAAGTARQDVDIDDVMRCVLAVTAGLCRDDNQRQRVIRMATDSVHAR